MSLSITSIHINTHKNIPSMYVCIYLSIYTHSHTKIYLESTKVMWQYKLNSTHASWMWWNVMEMITWKQVQIKSWFVEQNDIFQPNYSSLKIGFTAKPIKRRNNFYQSLNQNPQLNNANNIKSNPNHNFLLRNNSNQHRMINSRTKKKKSFSTKIT